MFLERGLGLRTLPFSLPEPSNILSNSDNVRPRIIDQWGVEEVRIDDEETDREIESGPGEWGELQDKREEVCKWVVGDRSYRQEMEIL